MMTTSGIYDDAAEQAVAAVAAFSQAGARLAADRLDAADFHDPRAWWVVTAARDVQRSSKDDAPLGARVLPAAEPEWWREDAVADAAGVDRLVLRDWCRHAPCATDAAGHLAARVRDAARKRRHLAELLDELELLGCSVEVTP